MINCATNYLAWWISILKLTIHLSSAINLIYFLFFLFILGWGIEKLFSAKSGASHRDQPQKVFKPLPLRFGDFIFSVQALRISYATSERAGRGAVAVKIALRKIPQPRAALEDPISHERNSC